MPRIHVLGASGSGTTTLGEMSGDMVAASAAFLEWAASYDTAGPEQRSLAAHEAWLAVQKAPRLRLDSCLSIQHLALVVLSRLS